MGTNSKTNQIDVRPTARFAIVCAEYNHGVVDNLRVGADECLKAHGFASAQRRCVKVPGAFEIPLACQMLAKSGDFDAVIALGAVIRGDTPHFEFVSNEVARGCSQVMLETGVPIAFGVLTTDNHAQAIARSGIDSSSKENNKGLEAARTALQMVALVDALRDV